MVAAEWQVTLVLMSNDLLVGRALLPKKPDVCVCPAVPGGHSFREPDGSRFHPAKVEARVTRRGGVSLRYRNTWSSPSSAPSLARPSKQGLRALCGTRPFHR